MNAPSGSDLLKKLIELLADQIGVSIVWELERRNEHEEIKEHRFKDNSGDFGNSVPAVRMYA